MSTITLIIDGYRKIFSSPNALLKNICLFAITGLISVISIYFESFKTAKNMPTDMTTFFFALLGMIILGVYICGYTYEFMHKAFNDSEEELLPDFDMAPVGTFFKALPLVIVWMIYLGLIMGVMGITIAAVPFIGIIFAIVFLCLAVFLTFVFVAYCENFETRGLYNIALPFKFILPTIGQVALLGLLFIPVGILSLVPSFIAGFIFGLTGYADTNIPAWIGGLLGGYFGCLAQFVWYYCLVQVYKEKIKPKMDEQY